MASNCTLIAVILSDRQTDCCQRSQRIVVPCLQFPPLVLACLVRFDASVKEACLHHGRSAALYCQALEPRC
eukprot:6806806-Alexandrium_andersonii.AAC.1